MNAESTHGVLALPPSIDGTPPTPSKFSRSEKTALYVPNEALTDCGFKDSNRLPGVQITRDVLPVLGAVTTFGEVGKRYAEEPEIGLEIDPSKKQVIVYAAVTANEHVLWYKRAGGDAQPVGPGEGRLWGRFSVGFGGHKTAEDIALTNAERLMLAPLTPGLNRFFERALGTSRGLFAEVEEEIGIKQHDILRPQLLGGFIDNRVTNPADKVQVGWVHMCVPATIDLDPASVQEIRFDLKEIANAWWVPKNELADRLAEYQKTPGVTVESWTEVMVREFLT